MLGITYCIREKGGPYPTLCWRLASDICLLRLLPPTPLLLLLPLLLLRLLLLMLLLLMLLVLLLLQSLLLA